MALQNNVNYKGISINAYCRITALILKYDGKALVEMSYLKDRDATQIIYGEHFEFPFDKAKGLTFADGYTLAKTLPKFATATDILENNQVIYEPQAQE